MAIHFGENFDSALSYANNAFRSFGGWFLLVLLWTAAVVGIVMLAGGILSLVFGMLYIVSPELAADPTILALGAILLPLSIILIAVGILLTIVTECLIYGFTMRVFRGGELNFSRPGKMFVEGVVGLLILFIYMIPYGIISTVTMFGPIDNLWYLIIVGILIPLVVMVITMILGINAVIKYAKEGRFGAAFHFKELCSVVSSIGWLRYLGNILLLSLIIGGGEIILMMIPIAGIVLLIVVLPFLTIFQARFVANLYESVTETKNTEEIPE